MQKYYTYDVYALSKVRKVLLTKICSTYICEAVLSQSIQRLNKSIELPMQRITIRESNKYCLNKKN